ncbi:MAG: peptidylprolyl isomerase [Bacteroidota bacterium]
MRFFLLILLSALLGCSSQGVMKTSVSKDDSDQVLFTIDDSPVTAEEFVYVYKKNNINNDSAFTRSDIEDYLDLYVKFKLKIQEAERRGMDTTKVFQDEFNTYKEQLKKPYLTETKVADSLIQEAYDRMKKEVNASHILIKVSENASSEDTLKAFQKIDKIRERAVSGEDFAELAKEFSEDPSAKTNGGNLGYFTSFQMVYPFESAAYTTAKGEVSEPVRTRFGYHIIKVIDQREAQGTVEVSHIMIRIKPNKQDSIASRNKVFEIYEQATGGVPWNELTSQFSQDINTKEKGGKLRAFSVGQMPFSFQEAAFALNEIGEISDPFMTPYGWHIVKLEGKSPLKPMEDLKATIKSKINRDSRAKLNKKVLINRLKSENGYTDVSEISDLSDTYFDSTLLSGNWKRPVLSSTQNVVLFNIEDQKYSLDNFFEFAISKQKNNSYQLKQYIQLLYDDFVEEKVIAFEDNQLEEKYIDYRMLVKEYREGILLFQLMEEEVWSKAVKDSVGLNNFFLENKESYQWKERIKATVYNTSDPKILTGIKNRLEQQKSLNKDILDSLYNQESSIALQVISGIYEKGQNELFDKLTGKRGAYEFKDGDRYNLAIIEEVLPAGPKELSETRGMVISGYQDQLEKFWVEQLRTRYSVEMNEKGVNKVYDALL